MWYLNSEILKTSEILNDKGFSRELHSKKKKKWLSIKALIEKMWYFNKILGSNSGF